MITRMLVLALVLAITSAVTTPALAQNRPPIPFGQDHVVYAINDWKKGVITAKSLGIARAFQLAF
jgi:hypothetical protein